jgi:hypothetical protein
MRGTIVLVLNSTPLQMLMLGIAAHAAVALVCQDEAHALLYC